MPASSGAADKSNENGDMFETLIRGATIVNAEGFERRDVGINDGRIAAMIAPGETAKSRNSARRADIWITHWRRTIAHTASSTPPPATTGVRVRCRPVRARHSRRVAAAGPSGS